jgi:putative ABC transport system ATP-binding protein
MDTGIIIEAINLGKRVHTSEGALDILTAVHLRIKRGDTLSITGASGSGKSTLLGLMAGLDQPSNGEIRMAGISLNSLDEDGRARLRARHVGFVFQSFQLLDSLSAQENVSLPLELFGDARADAKASAMLERVGLGARLRHRPRQLSGGEQQRVALARAFVTRPDILFADEPTGNLDSRTGQQIIELLFELNHEQQTTLILVTHDAELAEHCAVNVHLEAGRVVDKNAH